MAIYLFIYSFKLKSIVDVDKSAVDSCQLFSRSLSFVAKRYIYRANVSEEVNRNNFVHISCATVHSVPTIDRQTGREKDRRQYDAN